MYNKGNHFLIFLMKRLLINILIMLLVAAGGWYFVDVYYLGDEPSTTSEEEMTYDQDSWKEIIADSCTSYFDGCNNCRREPGAEIGACTRKACAEYQKPECLAETMAMMVDSQRVDCVGVGPMKCLRVKMGDSDEWQNFYDQIEGFSYDEGYSYELVVERAKRDNPPADASSFTYRLVDVVDMYQEATSEDENIEVDLTVTGYAQVQEIDEAFCEENCTVYDYVVFQATEEVTGANAFFEENEGNSFVSRESFGLGCLEDDIISYSNHSDQYGMDQVELSAELTQQILDSTKESPITLRLQKLKLDGGRGAPTCYSHFRNVMLADEAGDSEVMEASSTNNRGDSISLDEDTNVWITYKSGEKKQLTQNAGTTKGCGSKILYYMNPVLSDDSQYALLPLYCEGDATEVYIKEVSTMMSRKIANGEEGSFDDGKITVAGKSYLNPFIGICAQEPEILESGASRSPRLPEYDHLEHLGQLFSLDGCGNERLEELMAVTDGVYTAGSRITLKDGPNSDLISILEDIGYSCLDDLPSKDCLDWATDDESLAIDDMLRLKPYADKMVSDDCRICG